MSTIGIYFLISGLNRIRDYSFDLGDYFLGHV